jgi:hypothetical protein
MNAIANNYPAKQQAELLKDFGAHIGLALAFDDAGQCLLMVDEALISIRARDRHFMFYGMLGESPQVQLVGFWKYVLSLNTDLGEHQRGAVTVEPGSDRILLLQSVDVSTMGPGQLSGALREFVDEVNRLVILLDREAAIVQAPGNNHGAGQGESAPLQADDLFNRMA